MARQEKPSASIPAPQKIYTSLSDLTTDLRKTFAKANPDIVFDPKRLVNFVSSGNLVFDLVSGGGFPRRRLSEIFGMEHSGKSSLLYATYSGLQRNGEVGVLIDPEGAWDPTYARRTFNLINDGKTFLVLQPDNIEEIDVVVERIARLETLHFLAFDSVDAMKPKGLIERSLADEALVGAHARAMARFVAKMKVLAKQRDIPIVFTNQMRSIITTDRTTQSVGTGSGFNAGEQYTVTGGFALRFYASLRMKLEFGGQIFNDLAENVLTSETEKTRIGHMIRMINVKNKVGTPFLKGDSTYIFPTPEIVGGWHNNRDIMELLRKRGRVRQLSTKFVYTGLIVPEWTNIASKAASEELFLNNPKLMSDANNLLHSLLKTSSPTETLERVNPTDYTPEDLAGQDSSAITLKINLDEDLPFDPSAVLDQTSSPAIMPSDTSPPEFILKV